MKVVTIIQGIRFPILMKLVFRGGITFFPIYIARFLVLLMASIISSILTLVERIKYGKRIKKTRLETAPLFIVGHWRTGSTFLHQLMALDPQFTAPTMVQAVIPDHFLFSSRYYEPILQKVLPKTRPMDNVTLSPGAPQEEEWALVRMDLESPVLRVLFPSGKKYFLEGYDQFIPQGKKLEKWKENMDLFFRKITLQKGLRIVSKNPYHSLRIPILAEMYPGAQFIHIHRNPMEVIPSTISMWNIIATENALKRGWHSPSTREVAAVHSEFLNFIRNEGRKLEDGHFCEVDFGDLEKDPSAELERIYDSLGLSISDDFRKALKGFLEENKNYRKNTYQLSEEDRTVILNATRKV